MRNGLNDGTLFAGTGAFIHSFSSPGAARRGSLPLKGDGLRRMRRDWKSSLASGETPPLPSSSRWTGSSPSSVDRDGERPRIRSGKAAIFPESFGDGDGDRLIIGSMVLCLVALPPLGDVKTSRPIASAPLPEAGCRRRSSRETRRCGEIGGRLILHFGCPQV